MADLGVTFLLSLDTLILYHLNCRLYFPQDLIAFQKPLYCLLENYTFISGAMCHIINILKAYITKTTDTKRSLSVQREVDKTVLSICKTTL